MEKLREFNSSFRRSAFHKSTCRKARNRKNNGVLFFLYVMGNNDVKISQVYFFKCTAIRSYFLFFVFCATINYNVLTYSILYFSIYQKKKPDNLLSATHQNSNQLQKELEITKLMKFEKSKQKISVHAF